MLRAHVGLLSGLEHGHVVLGRTLWREERQARRKGRGRGNERGRGMGMSERGEKVEAERERKREVKGGESKRN